MIGYYMKRVNYNYYHDFNLYLSLTYLKLLPLFYMNNLYFQLGSSPGVPVVREKHYLRNFLPFYNNRFYCEEQVTLFSQNYLANLL